MNLKKSILFIFILIGFFAIAQKSKYNFKKIDSIATVLDLSIKNLDVTYFNSIFNVDKFLDKVIDRDIENSKKAQVINADFKNGFSKNFSFASELINSLKNGSSYDYLKFYLDADKNFHFLFRLITKDGINYHDYQLINNNDKFEIVDVYIYLSGENLSETVKIIFQNLLYQNGFSKKSFKYIKSIYIAKDVRQLMSKNEYKKANKLFKSIPKKIRKDKLFQIMNITISSHINDKKYSDALQEYEKLFPNDPSLHLLSIDASIIRKKYDKALYHIDKLDEALNGDSYLNLLRGNVSIYKKEYKSAINYFEFIKENYPNELNSYDRLLFCYAKLKNYIKAVEIVKRFVLDLKYMETEINQFIKTDYPKLYKSKPFKDWLNRKEKQ